MPIGIKGFQKGHGGMEGKHHSKETKIKIGLSNSISHKGVKLADDHKRKIGEGGLGRQVSQKTRDKIGISNKGDKHGRWKGENAVYSSKHCWIRRNYGNPEKCEDCELIGKKIGRRWNIDWSNYDHKYHRNKDDYVGRCQKCHAIYDIKNKLKNHASK